MSTDHEQDELDDGSAGGQIRWSPDNAVAPPASVPANAPMSWETLFSEPTSGQQPISANGSPQEPSRPATPPAPAEVPADPLFSRGPAQAPTPPPSPLESNPFTTPVDEPPAAPTPAPTPPAAPSSPSHAQPTQQNLGFNPAPQFSSSSDQNRALSAGGSSTQSSEPAPVKVYFTEEDIENEILREQGLPPRNRAGQQGGSQPPSPAAVQAQSQSQFQRPSQSQGPGGPAPAPTVPVQQMNQPSQPMNVSVSGPMAAPLGAQNQLQNQPPNQVGTQSTQSTQQAARVPDLADQIREDDEEAPDLSAVPEIETGRIWEQRSTKEILMGILKAKKAEYAVALLASTDGSVQGEMLIVKSVVIHGAKLVDPDLSGYEALKVMLAIPHGTYTLLDVSDYVDQAQQLEQGLNVRITPLANALPNLPDSVDELMGASNISRIRSKGPVDLETEQVPVKPPKSQTSLREKLPSTKILVLSGLTVLALIMMLVVLFTR